MGRCFAGAGGADQGRSPLHLQSKLQQIETDICVSKRQRSSLLGLRYDCERKKKVRQVKGNIASCSTKLTSRYPSMAGIFG
jgi:hypothetical protein